MYILGFRYTSPTRFSALAGTPLIGTPVFFLSKQTAKTHFFTSEPEHLEPDHKQGSKTMLFSQKSWTQIWNPKFCTVKIIKRFPQFTIIFYCQLFNRVTSSHSSTLWPCAHKSCIKQWTNISGKVFFLTSDMFRVFFWIYFNSMQTSSTVSQHEAILFILGLIYGIPIQCISLVIPLRFNRESKTIELNNWSVVGVMVEYHHWTGTLRAGS